MQDPTKTEAKDTDLDVRPSNDGGESCTDELASLRSPPETESKLSVSSPAEKENDESLECSPDTKSKKKKKRKKKKPETANAALVLENDGELTSNPTVEETDAKVDSHIASKDNSVKDCEESYLVENSPANKKKKKKKKKKKTESKVVEVEDELKSGDALEEKPDTQETSTPKESQSTSGITEEEQGDLVVMKTEKAEIDADSQSQNEDGDAVGAALSNGIDNEIEHVSKDSLKATAPVKEGEDKEENPPASEEEDSSYPPEGPFPEKVKPKLATMSDGAEESHVHVDTGHTDMPEEVESDTDDNSSDEPDSEG